MATIKNNHRTALNVAGVEIPGGGECDVPGWHAAHKQSAVIKAWVKRGILAVIGAEPADIVAPVAAIEPEDTERTELFAALAALGVRPGGRTGNDKLRAMLAEAQAANADSDVSGDGEPAETVTTETPGTGY